jgi:hypothetical protein
VEEDPSVGEVSWDQLLEREESEKKISAKKKEKGLEPTASCQKVIMMNLLSHV